MTEESVAENECGWRWVWLTFKEEFCWVHSSATKPTEIGLEIYLTCWAYSISQKNTHSTNFYMRCVYITHYSPVSWTFLEIICRLYCLYNELDLSTFLPIASNKCNWNMKPGLGLKLKKTALIKCVKSKENRWKQEFLLLMKCYKILSIFGPMLVMEIST